MRITRGIGRVRAPQPFLRALISGEAVLEGEMAHFDRHRRAPHTSRVCIMKADNDPEVFAQLVAQTGPQPPRARKET